MHKHSHGRNLQGGAISLPQFPPQVLIGMARTWLESKGQETFDSDAKKYCVDYLRHQHTPYDQSLKDIKRKQSQVGYYTITEQVFHAIAIAYPWLADEAERQLTKKRLLTGKVRLVKRDEFRRRQVAMCNQAQEEELSFRNQGDGLEPDDAFQALDGALTSLKSPRLLYLPPFLKRDEIIARRFTEAHGEMNDRWWEWEAEKELKAPDREQRFRWGT